LPGATLCQIFFRKILLTIFKISPLE